MLGNTKKMGAAGIVGLIACSSTPAPNPPADAGNRNDAGFVAEAGSDAASEAAAGTGGQGDPCPTGTCAPGFMCDGSDPGGGQCFKPCSPPLNDSACGDPAKFACTSEGHCYARCTTSADCARASEGYVCKDDEPPRPPVKFCDAP
jgi:hypothetical protein